MRKTVQSWLLLKDAAIRDSKVEGLAKKYSLSPESVRHFGDEVDPSPTGAYTEWIIQQFIARKKTLAYVWDGNRVKEALVVFTRLKNSPAFKEAGNSTDINSYKMPEFVEKMEGIEKEELSKKEQKREVKREKAKYLSEGCEFLGKVGKYHCYKVTTPEAATLMGENTHWCTQNPAHSRGYLSKGPLYVFTIEKDEEAGEKGFKNSYGSDKAYQFHIAPQRIECQNAEGDEIDEDYHDRSGDYSNKYIVPEELWPLFEFVGQHDRQVAKDIENGIFVNMEDVVHYECDWCGDDKMGDPTYNTSDGIFCSEACKDANIEAAVRIKVIHFLNESVDDQSIKEGEEAFHELVNSPKSEYADFFKALKDLVEAKAPVNPSTGRPYEWPSTIEAIRASLENSDTNLNFLGMLIFNLEQFEKVKEETLQKFSPLFTKGNGLGALQKLKQIQKFLKPSKERVDAIMGRVIKDVGYIPSDQGLRTLLESWGEIPESEAIEGEVVAHLAGWLLPDSTFVDVLDKSHKTATHSGWIEASACPDEVEFKTNRFTPETLKHIQGFLGKNLAWQTASVVKIAAGNQFWEVTPKKLLSAKGLKDLR